MASMPTPPGVIALPPGAMLPNPATAGMRPVPVAGRLPFGDKPVVNHAAMVVIASLLLPMAIPGIPIMGLGVAVSLIWLGRKHFKQSAAEMSHTLQMQDAARAQYDEVGRMAAEHERQARDALRNMPGVSTIDSALIRPSAPIPVGVPDLDPV